MSILFEQLGADHNFDRKFAKENGFVEMLRSIRIHVEQERMKEGPLNRLAETAPRGAKQAFKLENLARYYLTKDDLPNHEAIFQLAFMDDEVYALLDQVVKLWETQKLKGMKEPKLRKKPSSATEKGQAFLAKPTLTCSYLKELPSLQSDQQLVVLRSVIRGDDSLQSMLMKIKVMKEMDDVKMCFAKVAGKQKWTDVPKKYRARITDAELEGHRMSISTYMKKIRMRTKRVDAGEVRYPHQFTEYVLLKTRPDMYKKGAKSLAWEKVTPESIRRMLSQVNTFDGTQFENQTLKDGTKVVPSFRWKVIYGDSCDRTWKEDKANLEAATVVFEKLKRDVGIIEYSMNVEAEMLTMSGQGDKDSSTEVINDGLVLSWVNLEELEKETNPDVIEGTVFIVYVH